MTTRIAFTEDQFAPLVATLGDGEEAAVVVATSLVEAAATTVATAASAENVTLLAQAVTPVPEGAYLERGPMGLAISSAGWAPAFRAAVAKNQIPVFMHTHPGGVAEFSTYDDQVDCELAIAARAFGAAYYAAVVIAGTPESPEVAARLYDLGDNFLSTAKVYLVVDAVRVTGSSLHLYLPPAADDVNDADEKLKPGEEKVSVFDRQIRMLGPEGNRTLKQVRAAIRHAGSCPAARVRRLP